MRILLVEDNALYSELVRGFLIRNLTGKHEIRECANGHDALRSYQAFEPDWVVMDIMMGGSDGLVAARRIREFDPEAQIVMLTQYNERAYRDAATALGVRAYILKEHLGDILAILNNTAEMR